MSETTYCIVIGVLVVIVSGCICYWILACFCPGVRCCLEKSRIEKETQQKSQFDNNDSEQTFNLEVGSKVIEH